MARWADETRLTATRERPPGSSPADRTEPQLPPLPYQRYMHDFSGWTGAWRVLAESCGWVPVHRSVHVDIYRHRDLLLMLLWTADSEESSSPDDQLECSQLTDIASRRSIWYFRPESVEKVLRNPVWIS